MSVRTSHRFAATTAPVVVAVLLLGACGGSDASSATEPTIDLGDSTSTEYQTIPPATTIAVDVVTTDPLGAEQEYTVQAGDYGILVAKKFCVSLADLENVNGWASASNEFPNPGEVLLIPAGATCGESTTGTETAATSETGSTGDGGETGTAISDPGSNCDAGSHTVVAGDIPLKLVEQYDVTLEALTQANADNPAFTRFIPGDKIIIPAKEGC